MRKFLKSSWIALPLLWGGLSPTAFSANEKNEGKIFEYYAESSHAIRNEGSSPRKGLRMIRNTRMGDFTIPAPKDDTIRSIGSYGEDKELEKLEKEGIVDYEKIRVVIDRPHPEKVVIAYACMPSRSLSDVSSVTNRIPIHQRVFTSDTGNTHVYLLLPNTDDNKTSLRGLTQKVYGFFYKSRETEELFAVPFAQSEFNAKLVKFNKFMETYDNLTPDPESIIRLVDEKKKLNNELDTALDSLIDKIPGGTSDAAGYLKDIIEWKITKEEETRLADYTSLFPDHRVVKLPVYQTNGNLVNHAIIGRASSVHLDTSKNSSSAKGYVVIPQVMFSTSHPSDARKVSLENLVFEFMIK